MPEGAISEHHRLTGIGVKWYREAKGITQEVMGIDTKLHISHYESGKRNITLSGLKKIADYTDRTCTDLLIFADRPEALTKAQLTFLQKHTAMPTRLAAEQETKYEKRSKTKQ